MSSSEEYINHVVEETQKDLIKDLILLLKKVRCKPHLLKKFLEYKE